MKISITKKEYYINPEKKSVACKMYFEYQPDKLMSDNELRVISKFIVTHKNVDLNSTFNGFKGSVVGVATCSGEDIFNEKLGRHIAETKAQLKYNKVEKKFLESMGKYHAQKFQELLTNAQKNHNSYEYLVDLLNKQINDPV